MKNIKSIADEIIGKIQSTVKRVEDTENLSDFIDSIDESLDSIDYDSEEPIVKVTDKYGRNVNLKDWN